MNPVRSGSRGRPDGQESFDRVEPVFAQRPRNKKSHQEELPTGNLYFQPRQEGQEGAPAVKEPELECKMQKMGLGKPGGERADGSDVKGKSPTPPLPAKTPKGDGL
ncbi:P antigen family member 4 isoform 1-T3 [Molossus nigricans]